MLRGTRQVPETTATGSGEAPFDPVDTALRLISNDAREVEEGFRQVYARYRWPLLSYIAKFGFGYHDRQDVLQEVMSSLCGMIRDETFDPDKPLDPLMFELAKRRAVDGLRRKSARREDESYSGENEEETLADLGAFLADSNAGLIYGGLTPAEKEECLDLIWQAICALPSRERLVMQIKWLRPYESYEELRVRASKVAEEELTYMMVKKAVLRASRKIAEVLRKKGYS